MADLQKCQNFADFLRVLNDGGVHNELSDALREMASSLSDHAHDHNGKASGAIALKVKFKLDGGVFEIFAEHKVDLPKEKPDRTILWATPENFFTVQNPRQVEMFGPREVRDGYGDHATEVRSV